MQYVEVPTDYWKWRESQGFTAEEISLLYLQIDSRNENEMRIYLESSHNDNSSEINHMNFGINCIDIAFKNIFSRGNKDLIEFLLTTFATKEDFAKASQYALIGHYQTSMVLFRSCFEGQLRMIFNSFKAKEHIFSEMLSDENLPSMILDRGLSWDDALNVNKPLSMHDMSAILNKTKFTKPIRNIYDFLNIRNLNEVTHRNMGKIIDSESFLGSKKKDKFDFDKYKEVHDIYHRWVELCLIIMQNSADIIQPVFQPILYPDSEVESKFPNYHKLTIDRLYNLN
tara:strand:- start:105 stop:956 length:852 start_codon:yes stop_codon:yes gene_type:complete